MSLRFIIGRAGTGKTRQCLTEIVKNQQIDQHKTLIYLVPEQATFYTEKSFLEFSGLKGTVQVQVLSFQRLAWRVLQETGGGIYPVINDVGKSLILRRLLDRDRDSYKTFAQVIDTPGFIQELMQGLTELKTYNLTPERLEACLAGLQEQKMGLFEAKLGDLARIYKEFAGYIDKKFLDAEDFLDKLVQGLNKVSFLENAEVWLDGFNGFTPKEYEVIRELLLKVERVNVTLCIDKKHLQENLEETALFYPSWETYQRLSRTAWKIGCAQEEVTALRYGEKHRFSRQFDLAFLEKSFFMDDPVYEDEPEGLKLLAAANRRVELEGTAGEILNLCREKNYRFQDIAVLFRDFSLYESLLQTVFSDYKIPYFLDKKRPLLHHPLVDLLQAALEVLELGWNYEPVFRYLKTDLVPVSRREVDLLENYCLAHGIKGKRWTDTKPWDYVRRYTLQDEDKDNYTETEVRELKRINTAREKAVLALAKLEKKVKKAENVRDLTTCLYELLEDISVVKKLELWSRQAEAGGLLEEAQLHGQVWHKVMELLDQLVEVLGDQQLSIKEYKRVINSGLETVEMGLVPLGLDQVLVGTLGRSRNPNMKAVFILGANEGVFPARMEEDTVFTDEERRVLKNMQIELGPTSQKRIFEEQFLVYMALTRAGDFLQVSCSAADEEGRALSPSYVFSAIEKMFFTHKKGHTIRYLQAEPEEDNSPEFLVHPVPTLGYLAAGLRQCLEGKKTSPLWWDVYEWYINKPEWKQRIGLVVTGLFEKNHENDLSASMVRTLYGDRLLTSVSKLERFKACPFSYFLNYGLSLKEREEYKLKAPDLGQFFHAALERSHVTLQKKGLQLADIGDGTMNDLIDEVVDGLVPQLQNELLLSTARYRYLTRKLKRTVLRAVRVLREHERRGTFRPVGLEISFGIEGRLPGLQFRLKDGTLIVLQGRIDRVDSAQGENGCYIRIIDFKSGKTTLSLMEIFYGLKLQLLAYLDVAVRHAPKLIETEAKPGGVLYFKIRDPIVSADGPIEQEEVEAKILRDLKMNGYLLKDSQAVKLMDQGINGYSELIPAAMKKDGEFYKNSHQLLTQDEFKGLQKYVEGVLQEIGEEIISGNVRISPYRYKGKSPCRFCTYQAVCRFDPGIVGQSYRNLPEKELGEIWYEIGVERRSVINGPMD